MRCIPKTNLVGFQITRARVFPHNYQDDNGKACVHTQSSSSYFSKIRSESQLGLQLAKMPAVYNYQSNQNYRNVHCHNWVLQNISLDVKFDEVVELPPNSVQ